MPEPYLHRAHGATIGQGPPLRHRLGVAGVFADVAGPDPGVGRAWWLLRVYLRDILIQFIKNTQ